MLSLSVCFSKKTNIHFFKGGQIIFLCSGIGFFSQEKTKDRVQVFEVVSEVISNTGLLLVKDWETEVIVIENG